jgi:hypothetical protein
LIALSFLLASPALIASQDGLTDDGREVLLKEDGSWEFRSNDRFANTKDGQRVRLKDDGTWEYVGNAPLMLKEQVRTTLLDIRLQRVDIEIHKEKVNKNLREEKQTVFYLNVGVSPAAKNSMPIADTDLSLIEARHDKGKSFPILSMTPSTLELTPGSEHTLAIRMKGAPSIWDGAKSMQLKLAPGVLGNTEPVILSQNISDMEKKYVEDFE